jgi:predicted DNA-binding transcriptional regulator AlpA
MAYMTTAELAELVRSPEATVRYWRHCGKGPRSFRLGKRVLYDIRDVDAWLEALQSGAETVPTANAS